MAEPSALNPLNHIIKRQYNDNVMIKNKIFKERLAKARNLYRKDLLAHYGCVNAIEFSNEGDLLVSGGDDRRVLLWSLPEAIFGKKSPAIMQTNHVSNIFCLAFDSKNVKIFSGGNDDQVIIHDAITGNLVGKLPHKSPVYGLSINPQNDNVLATASDDGKILLFDVRESPNSDALCLAKEKAGFHSVHFNPTNPRLLVTANSEEGIALWDCRKPKDLMIQYDANAGSISGISACFNANGTKVLALRRRLPPVLYATNQENAICQFYHPQYYNSCTMKTCTFAGDDDEYILSGSDDFNLYMWKMPMDDDNTEWGRSHLVLKGHRSIVNQVRYNKQNNLIASSGVEKMIKLWSTLPIGTWKGSLQKEHNDALRAVYTHEDYIYLVGHSGGRISHDYSEHSTQEDSKMLAFFDSLIQREIEGWESPSDSNCSDSDSDSGEMKFSSLLNIMFNNNNNGRLPLEDNKRHRSNRIAQLILKKRERLAKMAHDKSTSQVKRCHLKEKNGKKKQQQQHLQQKVKTLKLKKPSKQKNQSSSASTPSSSAATGDVSTSSKKTKHLEKELKLLQHKLQQTERNNHNPNTKSHKYRTRQSIRENYDSNSNNSFDAPSTSTGITSSNSIFRVIEQDSDEEVLPQHCADTASSGGSSGNEGGVQVANQEENNFINILPTPLNGTHDMYINVLEMANAAPAGNNNVVAVRNDGYDDGGGSSGSNGTVSTSSSSSSSLQDECLASTSNGRNSCTSDIGMNVNEVCCDESDSDYEYDYHTPVKKRRTISASDSGCGTGPSSSRYKTNTRSHRQQCSSNFYNNHNNNNSNNNNDESDDEFRFEKLKKRINKARINISKQIGLDSDSN